MYLINQRTGFDSHLGRTQGCECTIETWWHLKLIFCILGSIWKLTLQGIRQGGAFNRQLGLNGLSELLGSTSTSYINIWRMWINTIAGNFTWNCTFWLKLVARRAVSMHNKRNCLKMLNTFLKDRYTFRLGRSIFLFFGLGFRFKSDIIEITYSRPHITWLCAVKMAASIWI